ncbi:hypothetical protein Bbelb_229480 [Branchiostoma belcheri]|nr:hypothetical protein Bbelb_229480 [Branchiostoma belcheri]
MQPLTLADLQKGATSPGDCGAPHDVMPPWMDRQRFDRGREFIQRHLMASMTMRKSVGRSNTQHYQRLAPCFSALHNCVTQGLQKWRWAPPLYALQEVERDLLLLVIFWLVLVPPSSGTGHLFEHVPASCVFLSQFMALLIGFSVTPLLDVLMYTGKSSTTEASMRRYISTGRRLLMWHDGDVWDVNSKAHASVMKVRNMHGQVAQAITKERKACDSGSKQGDKTEHQVDNMKNGHTDHKRHRYMNNNQVDRAVDQVEKMGNGHTDQKQSKRSSKTGMKSDSDNDNQVDKTVDQVEKIGNGHAGRMQSKRSSKTGTKVDGDHDKVYISQYDMALTQAGFVGFVLYPEKFGICCTVAELEDYIFFWRGIGYLLGIEDRYNMCSGNYAETCSLIAQIENEVVKPAFLNPPQPDFDVATTAFVEGTKRYFQDRQMTKATMFGFAHGLLGLPLAEISWADWCRLVVMKWMVWLVERVPGLSTFLIRNLSIIVKRENPD